MNSKIVGTGSYLPEKTLTNADLEKIIETSDQWITERTGIKSRHIADKNETVADMGTEAALKALEMAGLKATDLDMIILGTTSFFESNIPGGAVHVQRMLGVPNIPAFDIAAACSGFIFSLSIADQYIKAGNAKRILVIGADMLSHMVAPDDRTTMILFGDAAGAVILEATDEQDTGIISTHLHSEGNYVDLLHCPTPKRGEADTVDTSYIHMKGNEVFKIAVTKLSEIVKETLEHNNIDKSEIDWLVPHQANLRIIAATAKKLDMPMERVVVTLDQHGNTSAGSVPTALDFAVRDGRIQRGQTLLLEAFGSGFTWGSALIKF
ncbi:beta-ketoacyl-ACP synthase III [Thalassotalea psychrophila]|uniref:Beta-ketoacyl-[acyl-carrier-protein] synthase III n=1 Tax=Thalassotalea psychrophila TaxID=3065647 RepID=A0ABY9TSY6_9GAMM|nr:beta-ketoacyl-ACP synthase III [Colwelliaceae bacterium SQ149]